jgi:hypothetical protein
VAGRAGGGGEGCGDGGEGGLVTILRADKVPD